MSFRWWRRALIAGILGVLACSDGFDDLTVILSEHMEESCDGIPCGWEQVAGDRGQARYMEIDSLGDRGVQLRGEGVVIRSVERFGPVEIGVQFSTVRLLLVGRCDDGSGLVVSFSSRDPISGETFSFASRLSPRGGEGEPVRVTAQAPTAGTIDGGFGGSATVFVDWEFFGLRIEKTGDGVCEVGGIELSDITTVQNRPRSCI